MSHFYERNIIEIKNEYTTFLINIITPFLYEGIKSYYKYAMDAHHQILEKTKYNSKIKSPGILKLFQLCLKEVPLLNNHAIETETKRIKEHSKCSDWFDDLTKAVIKSNIVLLTFSTNENSDIVNDKYHERINVKEFIHKCYIECARIIYNYPELFWHEYPPLEIKRNQRETFVIIEKAIKEAIRKMLPIKLILQEFLKNDYVSDDNNIQNISDSHYINVKTMVERDLHGNHSLQHHQTIPQKKTTQPHHQQPTISSNSNSYNVLSEKNLLDDQSYSNTEDNYTTPQYHHSPPKPSMNNNIEKSPINNNIQKPPININEKPPIINNNENPSINNNEKPIINNNENPIINNNENPVINNKNEKPIINNNRNPEINNNEKLNITNNREETMGSSSSSTTSESDIDGDETSNTIDGGEIFKEQKMPKTAQKQYDDMLNEFVEGGKEKENFFAKYT